MKRLIGVSACIAAGLMAVGCATEGAAVTNVGEYCGGAAYQSAFQGTVEYSAQGRSQVANITGDLENPGMVDSETQRRLANVFGNDMVPLFMSNYQSCVQAQSAM